MKKLLTTLIVAGALTALGLFDASSKATAEPLGGDAASTAPAPGAATQPQEVIEAAERFRKGDYDGALELLREVTKKTPDMPPATLFMVQWCGEARLLQGVRQYLEQTVMENPNDPEAYVLMGNFALREGRVTEGGMLYQKAYEAVANFKESKKRRDLILPQVYAGLASVADARQDWPTAQKYLEDWLKFDPKSSLALRGLARCLFQQKQYDAALEKLHDAAKVDAEILTPEAIMGQFYEKAGDRENAKKMMALAIEKSPKDPKTRIVVSQWAMETGQFDEAQAQAAEALRLDPKSLEAKLISGAIALFQRNYPAAEKYFEQAVNQSPSFFPASNNLALALAEQADEAKKRRALEYAQNNAKQNPRSSEAASTYGWVLYKLNRLEVAQKALEAAISGGQFSPDTAYYMAQVLADRGRTEQAQQWVQAALKSTSPFLMRAEAEELLKQLKK